MATALTEEEFSAQDGVADWRIVDGAAVAVFRTGSFVKGVEFINRVAKLAEDAGHHPDVELRYPSVTFRLVTHDAGDSVTDMDAQLAQQISVAAHQLGISADPEA